MAKTKTARKTAAGKKTAPLTTTEPKAPMPTLRQGTKQSLIIELLQRPQGATVAEMAEAAEWRTHTVRGLLAGALKKRLGLTIVSEKTEGRARTYRVIT
jgi:predicted transcriptional regulator